MKKIIYVLGLLICSLTISAQTIVDRENYVEVKETTGGPTISYPKKGMLIGDDGLYVWGSFGDKLTNGSYVKLFLLNPTDFNYSSASTGLDSLRRYMSDVIHSVYVDTTVYADGTTNPDTIAHRIYDDTTFLHIFVWDGDSLKLDYIVNP